MRNKSPFLRFKIINECLTNKQSPYPTIEELKAAFAKHDIKIEKRAIEGDLEAMRYDKKLGFNAPIAYNRTHSGYHYTHPDYNMDKLPLTRDDVEAFEIILESFQRFRGARILTQVEGMFDKLDKVVMQQLKRRKGETHAPIVDFEQVPFSKGIEHFDRLCKATQKQQPLVIGYRKFGREHVNEHVFHPYLLKEFKFRWYAMGYSETRRCKLVLALDRIENIAPARV